MVAKKQGGGPLNCWTPVVALTREEGPTIANEVPPGRPACDAVEAAVRQALAGLGGRWRARIAPVDAYSVEIASPDGLRCLAFVPNPERQGKQAMARRLAEACQRPSAAPKRWRRVLLLIAEEP